MTLDELALKYGTDKSSRYHNYCVAYEECFWHLRMDRILLLELGIGGYEYPDRGGESLRTWDAYFPSGRIVGVDKFPKTMQFSGAVSVETGDVTSGIEMEFLVSKIGQPNIIIDDASHLNADQIQSFQVLWPLLASKGFYCIEDTESSYWRDGLRESEDPRSFVNPTAMNFAFGLCHDANTGIGHQIVKFSNVKSVKFYRGLIVVEKA